VSTNTISTTEVNKHNPNHISLYLTTPIMINLPRPSYLKKVFHKVTGDKPSTKATQKVFTDETGNRMAQMITNDKQQDNSSAIGSPAEHSVRRDLEMISLTGKDKDSARSKSLGKRKYERSVGINDDQAKQQPAEQDEECTVCLELVATSAFPNTKHASGREHSSDVCLGCWDQHIVSEMRSKNFEVISCLHCSDRLVEEEVRRLTKESTYAEYVLKPGVMEINANLFTRYLGRGAKSCMQQDEEFQSCPSADCPWGSYISIVLCLRFPVVLTESTGAVFAKDTGNIFNCQLCDLRWCLSCDVPFHRDQSCKEYLASTRRARQQAETASNKATRACPKCDIKILKGSGCDHMTCRYCNVCQARH
jgi:hypothetical protein